MVPVGWGSARVRSFPLLLDRVLLGHAMMRDE
jgi:hypothetical protein